MNTRVQSDMARRNGITLLEVLIAAGILVVGLTSILAMLPAAGSLFGEASMSDRAAALAANAAADLRFRGFFKASDFGATVKTSVLGASNVTGAAAFAGTAFKLTALPSPDPLADDTAYGSAGYAAIATPLVDATTYSAGMRARVTMVIFKSRVPDREDLTLSKTTSSGGALPQGVFRITGGSVQQQEDRRRRLLAPCSWVAVQNNNRVRWFHVGSSWTTSRWNVAQQRLEQVDSCISFTDAAAADAAITTTVSAFTGILRVEDFVVTLD